MDGRPVDGASGTPAPQAPPPDQKKPVPKGKFGPYTAEARKNVKPKIPPTPKTPFQQLHGMFLPDPNDFFTFFERPLLHLPIDDEVLGSVTDFNHRLLEQMGFPDETRDFFNNWALADAEFVTVTNEESEQLLKEANKLLESAPDEAVYKKVILYKENKALDITPTGKSSRQGFNKLWHFFKRLFTSPFSLLSNKKEQPEFSRTLDILSRRVDGAQPRSVSQTEPNTSIKPKQQSTPPVSAERKEEIHYILNCRKQTPVYYDGELCHFQQKTGEQDVLLKKTDGTDINAPVHDLYLPPAYRAATKIVNPADVELPKDHQIDALREAELLYICAYIEKGDEVLYKGKPCTVIDVTPLDTSPQVILKTREGNNVDAALHHIQLPKESEDLPVLPEGE